MKVQLKKMKQKGFTLIELISVIVILGILAAAAAPQFVDLSTQANQAACDGVEGAILSAAVMNIADPAIGGGTGSRGTVNEAIASANLSGGAAASCGTGTQTVTPTVNNGDACPGTFNIPTGLADACT